MSKSKFDEALSKQLEALPEEKQPERDLWRGVALALESEPQHQKARPRPHAGWAAMAACVALIAMVSWYGLQEPAGNPDAQPMTGEALVQALSQQHEQQKQALLVEYTDTPALADNWQQQLDELDDAAAAIKAALAQDPNNPALLRMLQNVYQQQIALIERVHAPKWQRI